MSLGIARTFAPDWRPFWTVGSGFINQTMSRQSGPQRTADFRDPRLKTDRKRAVFGLHSVCLPRQSISDDQSRLLGAIPTPRQVSPCLPPQNRGSDR